MSLLVKHLQPMVDKLDLEHRFDGWTIVLTFNYDDSIYKSYSFNSLDYSTNSLEYIISNVESSLHNKYLYDGSLILADNLNKVAWTNQISIIRSISLIFDKYW